MLLRQHVRRVADGLRRLATLERVLALVCILIPAFLIVFDDLHVRKSLSAYYDMRWNQVFYFSLTVACMLFVVNGVVKRKRAYDTILGAMLAGVILFNCHDAPFVHTACASVFFGGNGVVILFFSSRKEKPFKLFMAGVIVLALLGHFAFQWFSLFWAEWVSLAIVTVHYFIEAGYPPVGSSRGAGGSAVHPH